MACGFGFSPAAAPIGCYRSRHDRRTPGEKVPLPADSRILVSAPLELEYWDTHWTEVPEWSTATMRPGADPVIADFTPTAP